MKLSFFPFFLFFFLSASVLRAQAVYPPYVPGTENLAFHKNTRLSSIFKDVNSEFEWHTVWRAYTSTKAGFHPEHAVDGVLTTEGNNGVMTHNRHQDESTETSYFDIDLGRTYRNISRINVLNRSDCCQHRLKQVYTFFSDTEPPTDGVVGGNGADENPEVYKNQPGVSYDYHSNSSGGNLDVNLSRSGRYFRLSLTPGSSDYRGTASILNLSEVEIYGLPDGIETTGYSGSLVDGGGAVTFSVVLNSRPAADVTLNFGTPDSSLISLTPSVVFTPDNWNVFRKVTVTPERDPGLTGTLTATINVSFSSTDAVYGQLFPVSLNADVMDAETPGLVLSPSDDTPVIEGGNKEYLVTLTKEPTGIASVSLSADDGASFVPPSVELSLENWSTGQTVALTYPDNDDADGTRLFRVRATADQAGTNAAEYASPETSEFYETVADDDSPGYFVQFAAASLIPGDSVNLSVRLLSRPDADVDVLITSGNASILRAGSNTAGADTTSVTFTQWNFDQFVNVPVYAAGAGETTLTVETRNTTKDTTGYYGLKEAPLAVEVLSTAAAGIIAVGEGVMVENGSVMNLKIKLSSAPSSDVTVSVTPSAGYTMADSSAVFTPSNFSSFRWFSISRTNNEESDGIRAGQVSLSASSADPQFEGLVSGLSFRTMDDDSAGIVVTELNKTSITEGETAGLTVYLTSKPTSDVTVTLTSSDPALGRAYPADNSGAGAIVFTPENWNSPRAVEVSAIDGANKGGRRQFLISFPVSTSDQGYATMSPPPLSFYSLDKDSPALILIGRSGPSASEKDQNLISFSFRPSVTSASPITVALTSDTPGRVTVSPAEITFPPNTLTPMIMSVGAADNNISDGNAEVKLSFTASSGNPVFDGSLLEEDLLIVDDDSPAVILNGPAAPPSEDGTPAAFTLSLANDPGAPVTVSPESLNPAEVTVSPSALEFTPGENGNWGSPKTITLTGLDDDIADGDAQVRIRFTVSSPGSYHGLAVTDLETVNADNDTAGVTITPSQDQTLAEDTTTPREVKVKLRSRPTAPVEIYSEALPPGRASATPAGVTFSPEEWASEKTFTLNAIPNETADGDTGASLRLTLSSQDPAYDSSGLTVPEVTGFTVTDDDIASLSVTATGTRTTEDGGTVAVRIGIGSRPTGPVPVNFEIVSGANEAIPDRTQFIFDGNNYSSEVLLTLTGLDDAVQDGDAPFTLRVSVDPSAPDFTYRTIAPRTVSFVNDDDDSAGISVSGVEGIFSEGAEKQGLVSLLTRPLAPVTVSASLSGPGAARMSVTPAEMIFTPDGFSAPRAVTVSALPDDELTGDLPVTVTFTVTDSGGADGYSAAPVVNLPVTFGDGDVLSVISGGTPVSLPEDGGTVTKSFRLSAIPNSPVTVTPTVETGFGAVTVSPASLTFGPENWNSASAVFTVSATDNDVKDGDRTARITWAVDSADAPEETVADTVITVTDDDAASFVLSGTDSFTGAGENDGVTRALLLRLGSEPLSPVTVSVTSSDPGVSVSPTSVTLDRNNWAGGVALTVITGDDDVADGTRRPRITFRNGSSGPDYAGLNPTPFSFNLADDDTASIVTESLTAVTGEDGTPVGVRYRLSSRPTGPVTLNLSVGGEAGAVSLSASSLVISPESWETGAEVTLRGIDDEIAGGGRAALLRAVAAGAVEYTDVAAPEITVTVTDNDTAGIHASVSSALTSENGDLRPTLFLSLSSRPTADVTVGFVPSSAGIADFYPETVTFSPDDWNLPARITVSGRDDDGTIQGTRRWSLAAGVTASADPDYAAAGPVTLDMETADNDLPYVIVGEPTGILGENGDSGSVQLALTAALPEGLAQVIGFSTPEPGIYFTVNGQRTDRMEFTSADGTRPRTVTVSAEDDGETGSRKITVFLNSESTGQTFAPLTFTVLDDEPVEAASIPVFTPVSPLSGQTLPAGTVEFSYVVEYNDRALDMNEMWVSVCPADNPDCYAEKLDPSVAKFTRSETGQGSLLIPGAGALLLLALIGFFRRKLGKGSLRFLTFTLALVILTVAPGCVKKEEGEEQLSEGVSEEITYQKELSSGDWVWWVSFTDGEKITSTEKIPFTVTP